MRLAVLLLSPALLVVDPAMADGTRFSVSPSAETDSVATVGTSVLERSRYTAVDGAVLKEDLKVPLYPRIKAGAFMRAVGSRAKFKACDVESGHCGLDDDGDGTFDRSSYDDFSIAMKTTKAAYERREIPLPEGDVFKQVVTFLGFAGGVLRLSYREFNNDLARPAFTEDYSFEISSFPQAVAFKDVRMTVYGAGADGLRYRINELVK